MDKLSEIMAHKRREIAGRIRPVKERELQRHAEVAAKRKSFRNALVRPENKLAVIAEIKRRSPSAGTIAALPHAEEQARLYINAEADALSVLTDETFFGGSLKDLWEVTDFIRDRGRLTPCLRKDFMVHPIQILEAAEAGACAILIIVRALNDDEIRTLFDAATLAGLDALFEVHDEAELERSLRFSPKIVGVNNRDLGRFVTDLSISEALIPKIPSGVIAVSESGIATLVDAQRAADCGAQAILVGEALMKHPEPEELLRDFRSIELC